MGVGDVGAACGITHVSKVSHHMERQPTFLQKQMCVRRDLSLWQDKYVYTYETYIYTNETYTYTNETYIYTNETYIYAKETNIHNQMCVKRDLWGGYD